MHLLASLMFCLQELDIILGERFDLSEATDELAMEEKNIATRKQDVDSKGK